MTEMNNTLREMIKGIIPSLIANDLVGVQPMVAPSAQKFKLNYSFRPMMVCDFCQDANCGLSGSISSLHRYSFKSSWGDTYRDYYLNIDKTQRTVESFFKDILLFTFDLNTGFLQDYFGEGPFIMDEFSTQISNLIFAVEYNSPPTFGDKLSDHGIYII